MKRLCIGLCCVLLVLTACGRGQTALPTETVTTVTETVPTQTEPDEAESTELPPETQTETQTEPAATETQAETTAKPMPTTAAATRKAPTTQKAQTTREAYTLFTTPVRTTGVTTTTTRPSTTATTTTKPTTTTTTTTRLNVEQGRNSVGRSSGGSTGGSGSGSTPSVTPDTPTHSSSTTKPAVPSTTKSAANTCTVTIDCREVLEHPDKLKTPEKIAFVPKNGYIVKDVKVEFKEGESVFDVLRKVCQTQTCTDNCRFCQAEGIQMESTYTPQFDNYYVEGIHQLYEKDCGGTSGWTYWVNGVFPNYGSSSYIVKPGDRIVWVYSLELDPNESASFE